MSAQQALPPALESAIDQVAREEMAALHEPSLAISIVNDGRLIFVKGYGLSDVENQVPASGDTVYRIASLSKPLTATCGDADRRAPQIGARSAGAEILPAFGAKQWPVTVRDLLTHQSGIRLYKNDEESVNTRHYTSIKRR
jgi:CubicO group peptidase (beta-lactamase class C family)